MAMSAMLRQKRQQHQPINNTVFRKDGVYTHNLVLCSYCSTTKAGVVWVFRLTVSSDHLFHTNYHIYQWFLSNSFQDSCHIAFERAATHHWGIGLAVKTLMAHFYPWNSGRRKVFGGNGSILTMIAWLSNCESLN